MALRNDKRLPDTPLRLITDKQEALSFISDAYWLMSMKLSLDAFKRQTNGYMVIESPALKSVATMIAPTTMEWHGFVPRAYRRQAREAVKVFIQAVQEMGITTIVCKVADIFKSTQNFLMKLGFTNNNNGVFTLQTRGITNGI